MKCLFQGNLTKLHPLQHKARKHRGFGSHSRNSKTPSHHSQAPKEMSSPARRRQKRFMSYPRYVEVMVAMDSQMEQHHGRNLQHYILTLIAIVASIFRDPSIGNQVNIVLVKLIVIHDKQEGPSMSFNAAKTLSSFCIWQQAQNNHDDNHHDHYDTAILITREDICRARNKCDTLGLAEVGTICDPYRSCSINEDNGLSTAFTIAHELGHVFNMPHDDNYKCQEAGLKKQFHVMAPTLNYNTNPWTWSSCSRKYISEFLDTGYGECLLDEPRARPYDLPQRSAGQLFDANRQCELMFGPGSQVCPYMKQCKRLWCSSAAGTHRGCRTQHMPLADGTDCGAGMHCWHGMCVPREPEMQPVGGAWGMWAPFSACSRTCGSGIRSSMRDCNNPQPRQGGKYCIGRHTRFRSCNTEACEQGLGFREQQCSAYDGKHFNINGLPTNTRWVSKYSGILQKDRCKLFCRAASTTAYYQLRDRVIDGTPCDPGSTDVCVQGLCRQAGCDHVLGSKVRRDKCGVCGGDNTLCRTVSGTFNTVIYGYNEVVKIPAGATNIDVRQQSFSGGPDDDNYLALKKSQGEFVLNGEFVVSVYKREVKVRGAVLEYSGSDNAVERINCTERIDEDIFLMVLAVGKLFGPDIRYSFSIPAANKVERYMWDANGEWTDCTKVCQGEQTRRLLCVRESDHTIVSSNHCSHLRRPVPSSQPCNTDCKVRWEVGERGECSSRCGPGQRVLKVLCIRYDQDQRNRAVMKDEVCQHLTRPSNREACDGDCRHAAWQYSAWSQCSRNCGGGSRSRDTACVDSSGQRVADNECGSQHQLNVETCGQGPCPEWVISSWSECMVTCGRGLQRRGVSCRLGDETWRDTMCDYDTRPESTRPCKLPDCALWQVGSWGECSVTCGHGYNVRAVRCFAGGYSQELHDDHCNAATHPTDTQNCQINPCASVSNGITSGTEPQQTQWRFGSWTQCSASCGQGSRKRYVSCRDPRGGVASEAQCAHMQRPAETEVCMVAPCGRWQAGEWSPCSASCGQGQVTRQVQCLGPTHHPLDESECSREDKPVRSRDCSDPPCTSPHHDFAQPPLDSGGEGEPDGPGFRQWRTGPWGACSSTCVGGFQQRVVVCQDKAGQVAHHCPEAEQPEEIRICQAGPCPHWNYGSWSECSKSCGGGLRSRMVVCQLPSGMQLPDQSCEVLERPPNLKRCISHPCSRSPHAHSFWPSWRP
uniref:A disintegrin and metalloproteinase with thrombospondin motifs 9-like n=1 Tax=Myxine glutinosa TaxID=7769 RepID=UPI00358E6FA8